MQMGVLVKRSIFIKGRWKVQDSTSSKKIITEKNIWLWRVLFLQWWDTSIRVVLLLVAYYDMELEQIDAKTAFLYDEL